MATAPAPVPTNAAAANDAADLNAIMAEGLGILGRICPEEPETTGTSPSPGSEPRMLEVGETIGYWFDEDEDVYCSAGVMTKDALGQRIGFPRSWPECYSASKPLRRLVGKKGVAGVRTGVVDAITSESDWHAAASFLRRHGRESSFVTAMRVARERPGWDVVKGFVVYELVDAPEGTQFVAHRHWWNMNPETQTFVDLTYANDLHCDMIGSNLRLLVESAKGDKRPATVSVDDISRHHEASDAFTGAVERSRRQTADAGVSPSRAEDHERHEGVPVADEGRTGAQPGPRASPLPC